MNGILIVDKPPDWTSHDVVAKLRGIFRERRIGHGGTLDPMATGVLPVFIGRATRAAQFCENANKEYIAGLRLGLTYDTQDITGNILSECANQGSVQADEFLRVLNSFKGAQKQIPPMYSAVKIGGKKLYELARRGIETERPARNIFIEELQLLRCEGCDYTLRIVCSKGTYIRTLCHDIGQKLGCGGVMYALRRTRAGVFTEQDAVTLSAVEEAAQSGAVERFIKPVDTLFSGCPVITLRCGDVKRCKNGSAVDVCGCSDGRYRVYAADGEFLMLGEVNNGRLITVKSFFEVT